ncbi:MAG: hypothetical protein IT245_04190 [Bacteroidia bacterium]|nr:hypothetical protein [Bacteroidia bacterium]
MKISELKNLLSQSQELNFLDINGLPIPAHFHITELGLINRHSIDCGKDIHQQSFACFQIWVANDIEHRLSPSGMLGIIELSLPIIGHDDLEIEVEYQTETIGRYDLIYKNNAFQLVAKYTDCLAKDKCGIPEPRAKKKLQLSELGTDSNSCCTPGGGCC